MRWLGAFLALLGLAIALPMPAVAMVAMAMSHHVDMAQADHCQPRSDKSDGKAMAAKCCVLGCSVALPAVATLAAAGAAALPATSEPVVAFDGIDRDVAVPPPRFARDIRNAHSFTEISI